jgi:hypothetical protein
MKDSLYHYQFSCSQAYTDISPEDLFQRYLNLLEEKAKLYPYQWYNFILLGRLIPSAIALTPYSQPYFSPIYYA